MSPAIASIWKTRFIAGAFALSVVVLLSSLGFGAAATDREFAEETLRLAEATPAEKAITKEWSGRVRSLLDQAASLRQRGDETHARIAESAARAWSDATRVLLRTAALEEKSARLRSSALDAGATTERERAILEETVSDNGRLRTQAESLEKQVGEGDAGVKKAPAPKGKTPAPKKPAGEAP